MKSVNWNRSGVVLVTLALLCMLLASCGQAPQKVAAELTPSVANVYHQTKGQVLSLGMHQDEVEAQLGEGTHDPRFAVYSYDTISYGQGTECISVSYTDRVASGVWIENGTGAAESTWYLVQTCRLGSPALISSARAPEYGAKDGSWLGYSYRFDEDENLCDSRDSSQWRYEMNVFVEAATENVFAIALFDSPAFEGDLVDSLPPGGALD